MHRKFSTREPCVQGCAAWSTTPGIQFVMFVIIVVWAAHNFFRLVAVVVVLLASEADALPILGMGRLSLAGLDPLVQF